MFRVKRKRTPAELGTISLARSGRSATEPSENTIELDISMSIAKSTGFKTVPLLGMNGEELQCSPWLFSPMVLGPVVDVCTFGGHAANNGVPLFTYIQMGRCYVSNDSEWDDSQWFIQAYRIACSGRDYKYQSDPLLELRPEIRSHKNPPTVDVYFGLQFSKILSRKVIVLLSTVCLLNCKEFLRLRDFHAKNPFVSFRISCEDGPTVKHFKRQLHNASLPVDPVIWSKAVNEPDLHFGHGFVVAALLAGLVPSDYAQLTEAELVEYRNAVKNARGWWSHPPGIDTLTGDPDFLAWFQESKKCEKYKPRTPYHPFN